MTFKDLELTAKIKGKIASDLGVDKAGDIDVDVHDGVVDLKGDVDRSTHDKAVEIAKGIEGVKSVEDHLNISSM